MRLSTPNSSLKKRLPCINWRTRDSPEVRLVSDSTHMPPSGSQRFSFTISFTLA